MTTPTLNLTPQKTCPPGYHWVDTPAGPIMGAIGDLRARYLAGCVKDAAPKHIALSLGPAPKPAAPPPPPPPKHIALNLGPRPSVGTGVTSPPPAPAPAPAPTPAASDTVEAPPMADTAPALPAAECPAGLTWGGVAAAAGGSFFLGMLVGAVSFGGLGRAKKKKGRR